MSTETIPTARVLSAADLVKRFGHVSSDRICLDPQPGLASESDVLALHEREKRLFELVDGVLVEKTTGFQEGFIAAELIRILGNAGVHLLGAVVGADGMMRLAPGLVRIPDVSFISWSKFPNGRVPADPLPNLVPNLAVEVLSRGNTEREMQRKLHDYFRVGVELVWYIDLGARTIEVFTSPDQSTVLREEQILDGGTVLKGFSMPLRELFAQLD
jgi:Uma2 family endonuclease